MPREEGSRVAQEGRVERVRRGGERMAAEKREEIILAMFLVIVFAIAIAKEGPEDNIRDLT